MHGFMVARILFRYLCPETFSLVFGIIELGETVGDFAACNKKLKPVTDFGVVVIAARQWRDFCRVFRNKGWLL